MHRFTIFAVASVLSVGFGVANAATVTFFDPSQVATPVASGATSDTVTSEGYLFTYTRDKLFTGGGSEPIGRIVRVPWPEGVEAQAVTAGPNPGKAKITLERVDGDVFDLTTFTGRLLANTAGAGGSFEVVPFFDGEAVFQNPVVFNATGFAGSEFSYDTSPNPQGSTALLRRFDKYTIDLYVDFAIVGLTLEGAPIPEPSTVVLLALGVIGLVRMYRRRTL
jgi:PEP-CTERM motif-containing protein